eukprot:TRINITY_DN9883_c0_g1_i1.p1 TRINITY_DN9883_c0_g1~~TRINITY_DN9883_c0_g1_i1.p1  ORF type:complete len:706 (+),score=132.98 TRINITY_DN9883_c0_g1_i1:139-2118(+)
MAVLLVAATGIGEVVALRRSSSSSAAGGTMRERLQRSSAAVDELRSEEAGDWSGVKRVEVHRELFTVKVNFDIEDFEPSDGVTMVFDTVSNEMMLNEGNGGQDGFAWGGFDDKIQATGWSELFISTTATQMGHNDAKMYAAGFIEGLTTAVRISEHYHNTYRLLLNRGKAQMGKIKDRLQSEIAYMRMKSNLVAFALTTEPEDAYWKHVRFVAAQMWGLCDGYNFVARHFGVPSFELEDIALLNMGADLAQVIQAFEAMSNTPTLLQQQQQKQNHHQRRQQLRGSTSGAGGVPSAGEESNATLVDADWERRVAASGHCSAFVRLATANTDLLVGHTTWDDYSKMIRIFKYYTFPLDGADTMASQIGFSSYPGAVSSTDDYYVMSSGLSVMETSLVVLNPDVWLQMPTFPSAPRVPNFVHVMVVNRLASSAVHWARLYTAEMPAANAAQWMVVDFNRFQKGSTLSDNTLWVVETLPGVTQAEDVSSILRKKGYWASYDRPYFDIVRAKSGHAEAERQHGDLYSYDKGPRAQIFARAAPNINTLFDMRAMMTRNMYPLASVSPNEPGHEISARMDLDRIQPMPNGGIDAKITDRCMMKHIHVQAVSGPSHGTLPVFSWKNFDGSERWPGWPHLGQPDSWNYTFVQMEPGFAGSVLDGEACT